MARILIVDDDDDVREELDRVARRAGHDTLSAASAADAGARREPVDVALVDLGLPGEDGVSAVERVRAAFEGAAIVVVTAEADTRLAVRAARAGACDYLSKPWDRAALLEAIDLAVQRSARNKATRRSRTDERVLGSSEAWLAALDEAHLAAAGGRAPVLVTGECGTGKDVIARLVHEESPRSAGPFVSINAACLPATLLESELFGHEAGAFTDARRARRGLFEQAHGGTLFLDEIGELPVELQPKLLRVLEGHPFRRIAGEREIAVDVRLVAATNRDLAAMIGRGAFREDLYYRLRVLEIALPPLRERGADARELAHAFAARFAAALGFEESAIEPEALEALDRYPWPGNVRELKNAIERGTLMARGRPIALRHLPAEIRAAVPPRSRPEPPSSSPALSLEDAVRVHVLRVYEGAEHNLTRTASLLGITRVSLRKKLRAYGVYAVSP